jgi:hypothetical protein
MGAEQGDRVPEEDDGAGNAVAADAASCIVRRFVIDPGQRVVRDGSGQTVALLMGAGNEALGAGSAGAKLALGIGRKLVGAETPEPPAADTAAP